MRPEDLSAAGSRGIELGEAAGAKGLRRKRLPIAVKVEVAAVGTGKTVWHATLRRAKVRYFRSYDLRSTYATRLSAGGVGDEWVTQLLRQGDAKVFKKYSQMKLQMKREALAKLNRQANESGPGFGTAQGQSTPGFGTVLAQ